MCVASGAAVIMKFISMYDTAPQITAAMKRGSSRTEDSGCRDMPLAGATCGSGTPASRLADTAATKPWNRNVAANRWPGQRCMVSDTNCGPTTPEAFLLRSDNGLVFTSRDYNRLVRSYGLKQEFIIPHCPQQNGMVERVIRTLKEQCVHRHRFESQTHALRVIADWIAFYDQQRPHQALKMMTPDAAYAARLTA